MAPLPTSSLDLTLSSLELDARSTTQEDLPDYLSKLSLAQREALTNPTINTLVKRDDFSLLLPIEANSVLSARSTASPTNNTSGAIPPESINMKGIQALFALIGASFVLGAIWFFFWAKNGGFHWRKGDWEDYKSTVLRRKGPNGTTLSNATKSTRLGGGSVVGQGYSDDGMTMTDTMTDLSSEAPIIKKKSGVKKDKKSKKQNAREQKIEEVKQAEWEGGHDNDVRAYRHEKVARVGGINKDSDAQFYGTDYSESDPSVVAAPPQPPPPPHRSSRSTGERHPTSRHASPEKRQSRRDFSYGEDASFNAAPSPTSRPMRYHSPTKSGPGVNRQSVPGSFVDPLDFDVQSQHTKSYHHPIPGLGGQKTGGGFRRDRRDSLDD